MLFGKTAVVTRTKSRPLLLVRAIESVLAQSDADFVHVIVNDGGDPNELDTLLLPYQARYAGRLVVVHNPQSVGMEAASNIGIRACDSTYVVIHDDDDAWHPHFLARTTAYLAAHADVRNLAGAVSLATEVHERIAENSVAETARRPMTYAAADLTLWRMCVGNFFPPIAFVYARSALQRVGFYREDLPVQGDWEFNLRFMQSYEIGMVEEPLACYHIRVAQASSPGGSYSNSVERSEKHRFYNRYLRNELLRQDISAGRFGVGYMVNTNPSLLRIDRMALRLLAVWERLKRIGSLGFVR